MTSETKKQGQSSVETESFLTFLKAMWENWKKSIEDGTVSLSGERKDIAHSLSEERIEDGTVSLLEAKEITQDYKALEIESLKHLLSREDITNIEDMSRFEDMGRAMPYVSLTPGSAVIIIYALACASRKFIEWAHIYGDKYHKQESNIDKFGCYIGESLCRACGAAASVFIDPFTMPIITFIETLSREIVNEFKGFKFSLQTAPKAVFKFCKALCIGIVKGVGKAVVALADTGVKAAISVVNLPLTVLGRPIAAIVSAFNKKFNHNVQRKEKAIGATR